MNLSEEERQTAGQFSNFVKRYMDAINKKGEFPDPIDPEKLWKLIFNASSKDPTQFFSQLFPCLSFYHSVVPEFSSEIPEFLLDGLEKLKSLTNNQSLVTSIKPYIRLIPFLEIESILSIFEISISILKSYLKAHTNQIPKTFLNTFNDVVIEDCTRDTFDGIVDYFKEMVDSDDSAEVILILSYFALDFVKIDENLEDFIRDTIMNALESEDELMVICGFNLLNKYSSHFQFEPKSAPPTEFLTNAIFPRLTSQLGISKVAHRAAKSLIKNSIFQDEEVLNQLLDLFDSYPSTLHNSFFSLLHVVLYPVSDTQEIEYNPQMAKLKPIRSFVVNTLQNRQEPLIKGHCINVISDLMSIKKSFVKNCYKLAYEEAKKIIGRRLIAVYHLISPLLVAMYDCNDECKKEISKFIPMMCDSLTNSKVLTTKNRLDLAIDLASLCNKGACPPPPVLPQFAQSSLGSKYPNESLRAACIVMEIVNFLNKKSAKVIYERLYEHARSASDDESLSFFIRVMRKMMKRYNIDSPSKKIFLEMILKMEHPLKQNQPPIALSEFTKFIVTFIKCYNDSSIFIFHNYKNFLNCAPVNDMAGFLMVVIAALNTKKLKKEDIDEIWKYCQKIFKKGNVFSCAESIVAAISTLKAAFDVSPGALQPLDEKVNMVAKFIEHVDIEMQLSEQMQQMLSIAPNVCDFVLDVYGNDANVDINEDLLTVIIKLLPFPDDVKYNESIIKSLLKIVLIERFSRYKFKIIRIIASYLLLDKKDLDEFKFSKEILDKMKFSLKKIATESPGNLEKIGKHFHNQKRDMPLLRELVK
ncbi:hypothetical protein TRFO_27380 [Tritrichomonas foetus]|uniref:Uncharacterized protein n=1 Tax=Tritrichomonas foetus TaxID=1144522 RepID=A0A1J4K208_9EUKA|nr:hypothetical protein TRFO_27380 [Tritrichomonas foetus]|eukprot:OHT04994.1 hypothetical protein TRFO_27380 [Tritrichomonas foetus]